MQIKEILAQYEFNKINAEYEFQVVCSECEQFFGKDKRIWMQPYRKGVTENLMRYALKESKTRKKPFVGYFLAIINNKLKP